MNNDLSGDLLAAVSSLRSNKPVILRTDTIYGIIALASSRAGVEAVYAAKNRDPKKQCIVLGSDPSSVGEYSSTVANYSATNQPPTSVIVPATGEPEWLLRDGDTIAYRVTKNSFLVELINRVGPVIAPSANPEGSPPAANVAQARSYFGSKVGCYVDGGEVPSTVHASRIIEVLASGEVREVRV